MCEFGGLERGEAQGRRPELCTVEPTQVVGGRLGRQAAETLEELAACDAFAPTGPWRCSGAAAGLQPAVTGKQAGVVQEPAPAVVDRGAVGTMPCSNIFAGNIRRSGRPGSTRLECGLQ